MRAQAGLVHDLDLLGIGLQQQFAVIGVDIGASARTVEQITVGLAVGTDPGSDRGAVLEHPHRIAGRRGAVDLDVVLAGAEIFLLDLRRQAALARHREPRRHLHGAGAFLEERDCIRTGEDAAGRNQRDIQLFGLQMIADLVDDRAQVVVLPVVHAKPKVSTGQRALDNHIVGQALQTGILAHEQLQRPQRRNDDSQLGVTEARILGHHSERAQMQPRAEGNTVDPGVQGAVEPHLQGLARPVHGQLFHAVDEDHSVAALGLHRATDVPPGGFI